MLTITLFGLSKSLTWALLVRGLGETNRVRETYMLIPRSSAGGLSGNIAYV
jgi:hypothetical protein